MHLDNFGSAKVAQSFRHTSLEIIVALSNIKYFRKDFISTGYVTTIQNRKEVTRVYILLALIRSSKSEDNASREMAFMALLRIKPVCMYVVKKLRQIKITLSLSD